MTAFRFAWVLILLASAGPASRPAAGNPPAKVTIDNFHFSPAVITIKPGTTVTWVNKDDVPHTTTAKGGAPAFDSGAIDTDATYSFTFKTPGTFAYYCKVHPHMTATIVVK